MADFDVSGFLADFFDEARQRLQSINRKLVRLEAGELEELELIQLRRDAHTMKGSAQMLGVQDVSEAGHLFEDVIDYTLACKNPDRRGAAIRLLFDIHDQLLQRLQHVDGKPRLDLAAMQTRFRQLNQPAAPDGAKPDSGEQTSPTMQETEQGGTAGKAKTKTGDAAKARPRKRPGKRKGRVPASLLAAIKGSIEESLQGSGTRQSGKPSADSPDKESNVPSDEPSAAAFQSSASAATELTGAAAESGRDKSGQHDVSEQDESVGESVPERPAEPVDFRPDVAVLQLEDQSVSVAGDYLRVDHHRLTRLSDQIIELASGRGRDAQLEQQLQQLAQTLKQLKERAPLDDSSTGAAWQTEFDRQLRQLQHISAGLEARQRHNRAMMDDLRNQVFGLMLRPLASVFSVFSSAVRNIARQCDRQVQLLVAGDAVEMDQRAAEALREPLIHLINNAVAHGIEPADERRAHGKLGEGQITIAAVQHGGAVRISVTDDGRGINVEQIRQRALATGVISAQEAAEMDDAEITELIFRPGFTTHADVSGIAGRGMGMSVVADVIHELTGTIHLHSEPGRGSCFTLTIPVSVALQQARVFTVDGERFGMLDSLIQQVMPYTALHVKTGAGALNHDYIEHGHHRVPLIDFRQVLNGAAANTDASRSNVMIVEHLDGFLALIVDQVEPAREILVRALDPYLKRYQPVGLVGCTIAEDGSVLLLIDPDGIKEMWRSALPPELVGAVSGAFSGNILLVDGSALALNIGRAMFETMGFDVDTAIGSRDALEQIGLHDYQVLVIDLDMLGMDGAELIRRVRAHPGCEKLPILLFVLRDDEACQQALKAGANGFLLKDQLKTDVGSLNTMLGSILGIDEADQ